MTDRARPTNEDIADLLGCIADLLEAQDADRYRVNAYLRAAAESLHPPAGQAKTPDRGSRRAGFD